jgi:uncharacterized protein (TIGR00645 family)
MPGPSATSAAVNDGDGTRLLQHLRMAVRLPNACLNGARSQMDGNFVPESNQRMAPTSDVPTPASGIPLRPIPMIMFGSRWLQLPLYLGLIVAQGVYVILFLKELWHLIRHSFDFSEQQIMLVVLGLIDVVMISNLLLMVIVGGYETFVSRMNLAGHPDEPEWLSHVNAGVLKIKLAMAIIGISSIHLLRTFIEAGNLGGTGRTTDFTEAGVKWQTIIHIVFVCSAIGIAYVDRISNGLIAAAAKATDAHQP